MRVTEIGPAPGSRKRRKRVGRGHGCHVKTAGRGSKGQNARSGGGKGPGFEGGQTPWYRRLPKFKGFTSRNKMEYVEINLETLNRLPGGREINPELLWECGLIRNPDLPVKLLGRGRVENPLTVRLHKFTASAREAIQKAGGKAEVI